MNLSILPGALIVIVTILFSGFGPERKKFIPPGTVAVSERLFADKTEVTNRAWLEYETWTKLKYGKGSPEHLDALPDTSLWLDRNAYSMGYAKYYYRHPAYSEFPVVGVSHRQALAYCEWRTAQVKQSYFRKTKRDVDLSYRLPTEKEWEMLAMSDARIVANGGKYEDGTHGLNCYREADSVYYAAERDVLAPVCSYQKNGSGLWQCLGNVAEMVQEKNVAKGGSWRHRVEQCHVGDKISYDAPQTWLGFRCVCTVSETGSDR